MIGRLLAWAWAVLFWLRARRRPDAAWAVEQRRRYRAYSEEQDER